LCCISISKGSRQRSGSPRSMRPYRKVPSHLPLFFLKYSFAP
jgi:hypothetical protein